MQQGNFLQVMTSEAPLVTQGLSIHSAGQGAQVQALVPENPTGHRATKAASHRFRAPAQELGATATESLRAEWFQSCLTVCDPTH